MSEQVGLPEVVGERDRLRGHAELLHGPGAAAARGPHQERRRLRVLQHHQDTAALQTNPPLLRAEDPPPDLQSLRQGAHAACLLPGPRDRYLRQPRLLRRAHSGKQ